MKNRITGFALIFAGCAIIYAFAMWGPLAKNLKLADFLKGFTLGFGLIVGVSLVVLLVKRARENAGVVKS